MEILSIIFFFLMLFGLGVAVTWKVTFDSLYEAGVMRIAFGLALFTILAALFTILRIPLFWWVFGVLAMIPIVLLFYRGRKFSFKKPSWKEVCVFALFIFTLVMYLTGAFSYPLYENGDPWKHAGSVKYISETGSALEPTQGRDIFQYLDAYPPGYDVLLSVMHQTSGELIWSVKFFNSLMISLGILFFFFFVRRFTGSESNALIATFVLAMFPSYMSHFIWAHSLVVVLLFPTLYGLVRLNDSMLFPTAFAGVMLAQPTQAFKISLMVLIFLTVSSILERRLQWKIIFGSVIAGAVAILCWWAPMLVKYGSPREVLYALGTGVSGVTRGATGFSLKFHGTADRLYTASDFFFVSANNLINNPVGVGVILSILIISGIAFSLFQYRGLLEKENHWVVISLALLVFTFVGIHGERLPLQLWAFRFWMLFAIFASILAIQGFNLFFNAANKVGVPKVLVVVVLVLGIGFTSGAVKWDINTSNWESTAGEFVRYQNGGGWEYLAKELPSSALVFYPCRSSVDKDVAILGVDKWTCIWCDDEYEFKSRILNLTGEQIQEFATQKGYEYLYIDGICLDDYTKANYTFERGVTTLNNLVQNVSLPLVSQTGGSFLWKLPN